MAVRSKRERIHETQEWFQSTFESAATGMAVIGLNGDWIAVNQWLCSIIGYTEDELQTLTLQDIMPPDDFETHLGRVQELLAGTISPSQTETRCIHKQGHIVWILLTGALVKDVHGTPLYISAQIQDISDRRQAEGKLKTVAAELSATLESMRHRALHDALTDLPNRTLLCDRLDQSILVARRQHTSFVLLFLDLDRFKQVNDTLGHPAGDLLLQQVARRLREVLRESDTIARMGGDEFAIVLQLADERGAHLMAEKILQAVERPFWIEGVQLHLGASIGVATYPDHGDTTETLMQRADVAMYVAKRERLGYITYSPDQDVNSPSRLALAAELRNAIEGGQLVLHYQPKIHLLSGLTSGVEALVRWQHPEHGLIPPSEFVPVAEQAGFITPLSRWVIEAALKQGRAWQDMGRSLQTAVNLSATNLKDDDTVPYIARQLETWDVRADMFEVEITETAVMDDPDHSLHTLACLHQLGVRIAIDDFGVGHSSLAYLARLPVDVSKIDKSFVLALGKDARDSSSSTVVRSMIDLGHMLGLQVVGEGIENKELLGEMTAMHCDLAQGFYLCPPMVASDVMGRWKGSGTA